MTLVPRRAAAALLAAALAVPLTLLLGTAPAQATGYRYWSFWKWSGSAWAYQQQGPTVHVPQDGGVDGWRFAVSPDGGRDAARPTAAGDFGAICADTPAQPGRKRVAVVLDFGTAADAPSAEAPPAPRTACAAVPTTASSAEVLAVAAPPLRYDTNGLLCAIAGYPHAGCGDTVADGGSTRTGGAEHRGSGPSLGLIAGGALIAALAGGAVWQARRRRT
ncbi:SCO2322 family protein [Saccharothrix sp. ST-888]|uniref:SCO2322 family protein n=1 Tax=Saccharothrix sp. ST-888 TaxID=1427391 RepID=UPI000AAE4B2C|nr:SCO2322 family protein [Saccharothrix sp. ST-888]